MIELIIILAVVVFLLSRVDKARVQKAAPAGKQHQTASSGSAGPTVTESAATTAAKPPRKLVIDGTDGFPLAKAGFFSSFGIPAKRLCDARIFKQEGLLEDFPLAVVQAVDALYDEGFAMGAEVMRLVHHGRKLEKDEAVYFALTRSGTDDYTMFTFVDRVR